MDIHVVVTSEFKVKLAQSINLSVQYVIILITCSYTKLI